MTLWVLCKLVLPVHFFSSSGFLIPCLLIEGKFVLLVLGTFLMAFAKLILVGIYLTSFCLACAFLMRSLVWIFIISVSNLNTRQFRGTIVWSSLLLLQFDSVLPE